DGRNKSLTFEVSTVSNLTFPATSLSIAPVAGQNGFLGSTFRERTHRVASPFRMLYFAQRPDAVLNRIVKDALEEHIDLLDTSEEDAEWLFPRASRCFNNPLLRSTLERLLESHESTDTFALSEYHWLLLFECLEG